MLREWNEKTSTAHLCQRPMPVSGSQVARSRRKNTQGQKTRQNLDQMDSNALFYRTCTKEKKNSQRRDWKNYFAIVTWYLSAFSKWQDMQQEVYVDHQNVNEILGHRFLESFFLAFFCLRFILFVIINHFPYLGCVEQEPSLLVLNHGRIARNVTCQHGDTKMHGLK